MEKVAAQGQGGRGHQTSHSRPTGAAGCSQTGQIAGELLRAKSQQDALPHVPDGGLFHRLRRSGGRLQSSRRTATQTVRHAVVSKRRGAPAGHPLRSAQWLVRGFLDSLRAIRACWRFKRKIAFTREFWSNLTPK